MIGDETAPGEGGEPQEEPPLIVVDGANTGAGADSSSASGIRQQLALLGASGDMMSRFEALSRAFKEEVEGLVDEEKAASRVTADQLQVNIAELESQLHNMEGLAEQLTSRLREHVVAHESESLQVIFGNEQDSHEVPTAGIAGLEKSLRAFLEIREAAENPELFAANAEIARLKAQVTSRDLEITSLQEDLKEARVLKTQEERELCEFRALRDKESELQELSQKYARAQAQIEELRSGQSLLATQISEGEATLAEKSRKIVDLMKDLEHSAEQSKALADENNTLRLQLGRDNDYVTVGRPATADMLSGRGSSGRSLDDERQHELQRLKDELAMMQLKFPGLQMGSDNCRAWCSVQLSRQAQTYQSFLHRLQDFAQEVPGLSLECVSKAKEIDAAWLQREQALKDDDRAFQDIENEHAKGFEERRVQLVTERDAKIKQLLEQADKAVTKAEKQLLMQQAKLFGQRMDAKIEQLWSEQRQAREERWTQHNQLRQQSRQRFQDETLSVQTDADGVASSAVRFQDMAQARLGTIEDAWLRNLDKACAVNATVLKGCDLEDCLQAAGLPSSAVPRIAAGSQFVGISGLADSVEELVNARVANRKRVHQELEQQTLQQLRTCVEKFVVKEAGSNIASVGAVDDDAAAAACLAEHSQAKVVKALLLGRQHRMIAETLQRQFFDFMLVLRLASLGAARLLPDHLAAHYRIKGAKLDLPPLSKEMQEELRGSRHAGHASAELEGVDATGLAAKASEDVEARLSYESLLRRLLERLLTPLHNQHRSELLALKREHSREVRQVLQHLCQLDAGMVSQVTESDIAEYRCQIRTKLLSDCEQQVCEERRLLSERIDEQVELQVAQYRQRVAEEELAAAKDRRKWLSERLVVMQTQGASQAGDKVLLHHMRAELRACEAKVDQRVQELSAEDATTLVRRGPPPSYDAERPASASTGQQRRYQTPARSSPAQAGGQEEELIQAAPSPPTAPRPACPAFRQSTSRDGSKSSGRRPAGASRAGSPRGAKSPTGSAGRSGGGGHNAVQFTSSHFATTWPLASSLEDDAMMFEATAAALDSRPPCFGNSPDGLGGSPPGSQSGRRPRSNSQQQLQAPSANGLASPRQSTPSFGKEAVEGLFAGSSPPLYEWPFDNGMYFAGDSPELKSMRSLSGGKHALSESLPPLKGGKGEDGGAGAYSFPNTARVGIKSPKHSPSMLPSMPSPRGLL